jgi:hypothetical protein
MGNFCVEVQTKSISEVEKSFTQELSIYENLTSFSWGFGTTPGIFFTEENWIWVTLRILMSIYLYILS